MERCIQPAGNKGTVAGIDRDGGVDTSRLRGKICGNTKLISPVFLTFKCHVYIKECFLGILITIVNSPGDGSSVLLANRGAKGETGDAII